MIQCQQDIGIGDASKAQLSNKGSPAQLANLCQYVQTCTHLGVSINMGTPNGWFTMENPISMDDVKEPLFQETFISVLCEVMVSKLDNPPLQLLLNALGLAKKYIVECFPQLRRSSQS